MAGADAKEKKRKIKFESWKFPQDSEKARELIKNMTKMGSPVVDRGGVMSWLVYDELGIRAQPMTVKNLRAEMDETSVYLVQKTVKVLDHEGKPIKDKDGNPVFQIDADVGRIPGVVIDTAFGSRNKDLWKLRGTLTHPILNERGEYVMFNGISWRDQEIKGVNVKKPVLDLYEGYDPVSQYFFAIPGPVSKELAGIKDLVPTAAQIKEAVCFLDFFFDDFTFATKSAKASAIAFMLTMLCREIITSSIPMLEVRAPESQSGKSLLVKMMLRAITGEEPRLVTPNFRNEEAFTKQLFSLLLQGRNYVFLDDVQGTVKSAFLDSVLTSKYIADRVLGGNEIATVYTGMPFVMTANNPTLSTDMKNRMYLLDILKPPDNKEFLHKLPEKRAMEMGPTLIKMLFILYNNWDKNYKRELFKERRMGGFPEWSGITGGILLAAGIDGFLDDTLRQIKEIEPWQEQAADLAHAWYEKHGELWVFVKDALDLALEAKYVKESQTEQEKLQTMAGKLKRLRLVKLPGGYHFEKNEDQRSRGSQWRVVRDAESDR